MMDNENMNNLPFRVYPESAMANMPSGNQNPSDDESWMNEVYAGPGMDWDPVVYAVYAGPVRNSKANEFIAVSPNQGFNSTAPEPKGFCTKCGAPRNRGNFCMYCGNAYPVPPTAAGDSNYTPRPGSLL